MCDFIHYKLSLYHKWKQGKENSSIIQMANIEFGGESLKEINLERKLLYMLYIHHCFIDWRSDCCLL